MPYIKQIDRDKFDLNLLNMEICNHIQTPGELNYIITNICKFYIKRNGENYQHYNDIMGALEGVKMELYRRQISVYEDSKIIENGDV